METNFLDISANSVAVFALVVKCHLHPQSCLACGVEEEQAAASTSGSFAPALELPAQDNKPSISKREGAVI